MQLTAIDLFCGAGGLTFGMKLAGIDSVAAVEIDIDACDTFRDAFSEVRLIQGDIQNVDFGIFRDVDLGV